MTRLLMPIIAFVFLTSCATKAQLAEAGYAGTTQAIDCAVPDGWADVAALEPKYVVFGELHGTRESPAFFGDVACGLARRGERLLLAIEHSSADNEPLQAAWLLPTNAFRETLPTTGWVGRQDGVASQAMFEMMVRMHSLKQQGLSIHIVAFNGGRDQRAKWAHLPSQGPHEAAQAENIYEAASAKAYDRTLVLVGNYHAGKLPIDIGAGEFDPMARRLGKLGKTLSFDMRYADGSAWNCLMRPDANIEPGQPVPDEAIDCDSHPTKGSTDLQRAPFIQVDQTSNDKTESNYDGFFWVGPINGSKPLIPERVD